MDKRLGRIFPLLLLAALFAGCATTQVSGPAKTTSSAAFVSAGQLASNHAALTGQAKTDNAREIERLLSAMRPHTTTKMYTKRGNLRVRTDRTVGGLDLSA